MKIGIGMKKRTAKLGLVLLLGASMSACAGLFSHSMSWKEEVKLHDGQIVIAERYYNLGGYPAIESQNRSSIDETVTFNLPNSKSIVWKTDFRDSEPEPNSLNLIRFDVLKGVPYIATYPAGCIAYNKWGRPNPPQILFKYENEQWKRIGLDELPLELINTNANVIVGKPDVRIAKSFYTVEGVDARNYYISKPEYRTILREPVKSADGGCPVWIYLEDEKAWVTPSAIESKKRYQQLLREKQGTNKPSSSQEAPNLNK